MVRSLTQWTVADYHRMITAGLLCDRPVELLNGQIIDMAPELPIHRATYRRSSQYLASLLGGRAVIFTTAPITLGSNSEPQPDLCIARPPESRYDQRHPRPEDIYWLIEVSNSTLTYDLGEKAQLYARHAIQEYWVIDISGQQLWVHRQPRQGRYQAVSAQASGLVTPLALPDTALTVSALILG